MKINVLVRSLLLLLLVFISVLDISGINTGMLNYFTSSINWSSLVYNLTRQLQSYYNPKIGGFRAYPFGTTDYYDYWTDDAGKILTAASIVHNYTIAREAFDFLYKIRAYGYEMPARIVVTKLFRQSDMYYNNIIFAGGNPLTFGIWLFQEHPVAEIMGNYTLVNTTFKFKNFNIEFLANKDYLLVRSSGFFNITLKSISGENKTVEFSKGREKVLLVYNPFAPIVGNTGGYIILGNITHYWTYGEYLTVEIYKEAKLYSFAVTFDPLEAKYVVYGLLNGLYPVDADISTPASFGYIMLGLSLYGLETHNVTVIRFAKGFLNFWLPIVKGEIAHHDYYPRSLSTFFIGALLLEPNNESILHDALNYIKQYPATLYSNNIDNCVALECIGPTVALIHLLNMLGVNTGNLELIYEEEEKMVYNYEAEYHPAPFHYGEGLLGWLWAGKPYNSTIVLQLVNYIFNNVISGHFVPPFYVFSNYANTESLPAILESIALWQERMYNQTSYVINEICFINVSKIYTASGSLIVYGKALQSVVKLKVYLPNLTNVTILANGKKLNETSKLSIFTSGWMRKENEIIIQVITLPGNTVNITIEKPISVVKKTYTILIPIMLLIVAIVIILAVVVIVKKKLKQ